MWSGTSTSYLRLLILCLAPAFERCVKDEAYTEAKPDVVKSDAQDDAQAQAEG